jgi:hypothetical protein
VVASTSSTQHGLLGAGSNCQREKQRVGEAGTHLGDARQGRRTDNPSSLRRLRARHAQALLTVWSSGDATVEGGNQDHLRTRHYLISSVEDLRRVLTTSKRP